MRFDLARRLPAGHHQEGAPAVDRAASCCGSSAATPTSPGCRSTASRSGTSGPTRTATSGRSTASSGGRWPTPDGGQVDQIAQVIEQIRTQPGLAPADRAAPGTSPTCREMALTPCHTLFQFYVADGRLSLPALPALRRRLPRRAVQHRVLRAAHPHGRAGHRPRASATSCTRSATRTSTSTTSTRRASSSPATPRPLPTLWLDPSVRRPASTSSYDDIEVAGYDPHPAIKAPIAV